MSQPHDLPTRSDPPEWAEVVSSLVGLPLIVIGDVMLDEYVAGEARRVCPEAPVPVVEVARRWSVPGGAANAARNAAGLGGRPILGGVTGDDAAAEDLGRAIAAAGVDSAGLLRDRSRPTTSKFRVLARNRQVIRIDTESVAPLSSSLADALCEWAERMASSTAVLLSDYGKGVLNGRVAGRMIEAFRRSGRKVIVDPKGTDPTRYAGASVIKPNSNELADLTGRRIDSTPDLVDVGQSLADELAGTDVLVTRGAEGMALFRSGRSPRNLSVGARRRVYDVTGAGDTVAAVLALALAAGWSVEVAARVANVAAGIVVSKVGTSYVVPTELLNALNENAPDFVDEFG